MHRAAVATEGPWLNQIKHTVTFALAPLRTRSAPAAMPKRSLEEADSLAERLDGEWVGRSVMLKPAAARGKRLPETFVAKICRVSRRGMTASVLLQYSANGVTKTHTDSFHRWETLSTRYIQVQEAAAPLDQVQFVRRWSFQGPAQNMPRAGRALSEILPAFQLEANIHVLRAVGANAPDGRRAAVAAAARPGCAGGP